MAVDPNTLLGICQGAARAARVTVPAFIIGNPAEDAQLLLQLANDEGEALARRKPGGWAIMNAEFDFTTAAMSTTGNVAGSSAIVTNIPSTAGLAANTWQVVGSAGFPNNTTIKTVDSATQVTVNTPTATTTAQTGASITFGQANYPLPSDYERPIDGTFWDRSRFWQMRGAMSPQQWQLYKSSVLGTSATIQRRYRIMNIAGTLTLGIDPVPTDNGSRLVWEYVSNAWCQNAAGTIKQTQWLADTDTGVIDSFLIRKGVQYRLLERLGMASDAEQNEYEDLVSKAIAHDAGTQVIDMVQSSRLVLIGPLNVPDTGFGH